MTKEEIVEKYKKCRIEIDSTDKNLLEIFCQHFGLNLAFSVTHTEIPRNEALITSPYELAQSHKHGSNFTPRDGKRVTELRSDWICYTNKETLESTITIFLTDFDIIKQTSFKKVEGIFPLDGRWIQSRASNEAAYYWSPFYSHGVLITRKYGCYNVFF